MTCIHRRNIRRLNACHTIATARTLFNTTVIAMASALPALQADAAPTGGVVTAGAGNISQQGTTTTINQANSQTQQPARMVINWDSFSSAPGEAIVFKQPSIGAIALNRVTGASPSQLMGSLSANGQVFILNPNGVLFGAGSQVNAAGMLASTLGMDTAQFMAGNYVLQGSSSAKVVNQGSLTAADGGYVALVGPAVVNDGRITANKGDALLAAGDKVTLKLEGGSLLGYSMDLGSVNALVDNGVSGLISANGGRVVLEARAADGLSKAVVNHAGLIEAKTLDETGGTIKLIGDMNVGKLQVSGTLDASAPSGGNGGFVETSAAHVKIADTAIVTTAAAPGKYGTWLIDPLDFDIAPGTGERTDSSIGATTLGNDLKTSNILIRTSSSGTGSGNGDINVNAEVIYSSNLLVMQADRNINFNASMQASSLSLLYGNSTPNGGTADFYFNNGASIGLAPNSVFVTRKGSNPDNTKSYQVIGSLGAESKNPDSGTLQGITALASRNNYVLGTDLNAGATSGWNKGAGFTPLGELNGTFEGLGHRIDGLTIKRSTSSILGLFTSVRTGAAVRNLGLVNAVIAGDDTVGALAGSNLGTISGVYVAGQIEGRLQTGGLVGINDGTISGSHSEADLKGNSIIGGLTGMNDPTGILSDSYATGKVTGVVAGATQATYTGGLSGFNKGSIVRSYASGNTSGYQGVGGLTGANNGAVEYSYAQGSVNGQLWVGGLAGVSAASWTLKNSYATGAVTGADAATTRGLVGTAAPGSVVASYWNADSIADGGTGQLAPGIGESKTGAQLRQAATFADWNIASISGTEKIWRIYEGNTMPLLRSFLAPLILDASRSAKYSGTTQSNLAIPVAGARTGHAASGRNVGTYQPYSNQQGYDISNGELVITPRPLTINAQVETRVYNGTTSAKATLSDDRILNDSLTTAYTSAGFDTKDIGEQKTVAVQGITLGGADAGNYTFQNALTTTGKITPFNLIFQVTGVDKVYDGTTDASVLMPDVKIGNDQVSANRTASFDSKNVGVGKTVTTTVTGLQGADSGNYTFTQPATATASITPRPLDITVTAADKIYDGTASALALLQDNRIAGDRLDTKAVASFNDKNAGAGKNVTVSGIAIAGADAGNYQYQPQVMSTLASITPRPISITATAADKTYDGTATALAFLQDNRIAGDLLTTSAVASFNDKNAGTGKNVTVSGVAIAGADSGNYQYQPQVMSTTASITPRPISITATAADKAYDGTTTALAFLQDNRIAGDLLTTSATASFSDKNAGAGKNVTVSGIAIARADAGNYQYQPQVMSTTASITPRPLDISATATDKSYDGNTQTAAALRDNRLAGDVLTASYQRADFADKNGGQNKAVIVSGIAIAGDDAANYKPNTEATTSASIKPISLVITANPDVRLATGIPYQGGNGVSYSGLLPGETAAVLDGKLSYGGSAQNAIKEGVYQITPRGLTSANYASTFVDGTLTIQPLPPGAGQAAIYTESGRVALATETNRSSSATWSGLTGNSNDRSSRSATLLSVADCGMRMPDNLLLDGCQSTTPPGSTGR